MAIKKHKIACEACVLSLLDSNGSEPVPLLLASNLPGEGGGLPIRGDGNSCVLTGFASSFGRRFWNAVFYPEQA